MRAPLIMIAEACPVVLVIFFYVIGAMIDKGLVYTKAKQRILGHDTNSSSFYAQDH